MNADNPVLRALKLRYFDLLRKERIGETPEITLEADQIEFAIKRMQKEQEPLNQGS